MGQSEVTHETTLRGPHDEDYIPPEVCAHCGLAIEEDCVRLGMFNRWHSSCVQCIVCGDRAVPPLPPPPRDDLSDEASRAYEGSVAPNRPIRPPPRVDEFFFPHVGEFVPPHEVYCSQHRPQESVNGFQSVSRLEQYAFLLHIALRRLYVHYRIHHDLPSGRWIFAFR
jgi:hypothetical protein